MRAYLAWEDPANEPAPLPRWKRYCGQRPQLLLGLTVALMHAEWQCICWVHACYKREVACA